MAGSRRTRRNCHTIVRNKCVSRRRNKNISRQRYHNRTRRGNHQSNVSVWGGVTPSVSPVASADSLDDESVSPVASADSLDDESVSPVASADSLDDESVSADSFVKWIVYIVSELPTMPDLILSVEKKLKTYDWSQVHMNDETMRSLAILTIVIRQNLETLNLIKVGNIYAIFLDNLLPKTIDQNPYYVNILLNIFEKLLHEITMHTDKVTYMIESLYDKYNITNDDGHLYIREFPRVDHNFVAFWYDIKPSSLPATDFTDLCNKHIMIPNLDSVKKTIWLQNGDCNIFLIGERHSKHNKCKSIINMFQGLINDTPDGLQIDLMIELLQEDTVGDPYDMGYDDNQINIIRFIFDECVRDRNCPLRVHWTDPTQTYTADPTKNIPEWLDELARSEWGSNEWITNPIIRDALKVKKDLTKLLTENTFVKKEIDKASLVNPIYTMKFATKLFMGFYEELQESRPSDTWEQLAPEMARAVMDFYVAARIIKSRMKNVIYYAGTYHTDNMSIILSALGFITKNVVEGECFR